MKPGQKIMVKLRGPGGEFELPFGGSDSFGGPARMESRNYWIKSEGAEPVIVPNVERFGEKDKATGKQNWEDVPAGSALEAGCSCPHRQGKSIGCSRWSRSRPRRTRWRALGNDRAPVLVV